ncbi:hypothetical protein COCSADRAFT_158183 [Bipolaris sorokiniana ND90Pr]|uniref:Uncharacterized protein n=1 Tax=Cochliobolus sativus (strain ND90Pr / ATCC 201652) TaxID=665912 RepID=M2TF21_COCSN|nr:uncharacterized protein COCSADRAFT_158183 [Bipolaris sorokiniana ND90Pr]EMD67836.1 hypothetical protein COCSADRAFT_158183 [Bipolaris sorokiniana ND90Pr]
MRFAFLSSKIATSISILAVPTGLHARVDVLVEPRATPAKPALCVRDPSTTKEQNEAQFDAFVQALIYKPDITEAFSYIAQDYVNHSVSGSNGFDTGWNALSLTWDPSSITPLDATFRYPQG